MQVKVIKLYQYENEEVHIEFLSQYGVAKGLWQGNIPEINKSYYIELDIPEILIWGINITETDCSEYKIWNEQNNIFLNVKLESYEDDGCLGVRLGDSILLIETKGIPYSNVAFLEIKTNKIAIYPFDL